MTLDDCKIGDLVSVKSGKVYRVWFMYADCVQATGQRDGKDYGPLRKLKYENLRPVPVAAP